MIHMHRWDELSLQWMLDSRLRNCMADLLGREPFAVQTMLYFKPPGARGQALHQDQFYLRVQPGTCIAAWLALDNCDEENGCLQMVPDSHSWPLLCTADADTTESFTNVTVYLHEGVNAQPVIMAAGDVVFSTARSCMVAFPTPAPTASVAPSSAITSPAKPAKFPSTITPSSAWTAQTSSLISARAETSVAAG